MRCNVSIATAIALVLLTPAVTPAEDVQTVVANQEPLLRDHEDTDREFYKLQIGDTVSYFHQRMIEEAFVEGDFIRYQFNVDSGEVGEHTVQWRDDLPQTADPVITQDQAESMVKGDVQRSMLCFISPESHTFPVTPTPENPCWIVRSEVDGWLAVIAIRRATDWKRKWVGRFKRLVPLDEARTAIEPAIRAQGAAEIYEKWMADLRKRSRVRVFLR